MPLATTTAGVAGIRPDGYEPLIVLPVIERSIGLDVSTVHRTSSTNTYVPVLTADPSAAWVAEGAEITPDNPDFASIIVTPAKVAALTLITREMADDSDPAARTIVGQAMARDIARTVDAAYFGNLAAPAPSGLESLTGVTAINAGTAFTSLDAFSAAQAAAEGVDAQITAWVANPADALVLAQLKDGSGSNRPLLATDPTSPARRVVEGLPLHVSSAVTAGTIWGIPGDRVIALVRTDVRVEVSDEAYFSSDQVAVKTTMRVGFAFPHQAAIIKVSLSVV